MRLAIAPRSAGGARRSASRYAVTAPSSHRHGQAVPRRSPSEPCVSAAGLCRGPPRHQGARLVIGSIASHADDQPGIAGDVRIGIAVIGSVIAVAASGLPLSRRLRASSRRWVGPSAIAADLQDKRRPPGDWHLGGRDSSPWQGAPGRWPGQAMGATWPGAGSRLRRRSGIDDHRACRPGRRQLAAIAKALDRVHVQMRISATSAAVSSFADLIRHHGLLTWSSSWAPTDWPSAPGWVR